LSAIAIYDNCRALGTMYTQRREETLMSSSALSLPKQRYGRSSVSLAGVLSIVAGALFLLFGVITLFTPTEPRILAFAAAGLMGFMGSLGIATGWGLLEKFRWAQVLAIMWGIVLVSPSSPLPASISGWVGELIFVAIGIWWLTLFIGKVADDEFTNSESLRLPGAVLAVACLLIIDLTSLPLEWMLKSPPVFLYGRPLGAPYSLLFSTFLCVLSLALGVALLKRSKLGFWLVMGLQVFSFTNAVVTDFTPAAIAELNRVAASTMASWHITGFSGKITRTFSFIEPIVIGICLMLSWPRFKTSSEAVDD
jgi:hypothetical protein